LARSRAGDEAWANFGTSWGGPASEEWIVARKTKTFVGFALLAAPLFVACGTRPGVAAIATGDQRGAITEPATPPACARLAPQSSPQNPQNETAGTNLDTSRIQSALSECGIGHAVELSASAAPSSQSAFISGPLSLPSGVSLIIDKGVTLFASRQTGVYDNPRKPQATHCGEYDGYGRSCRPFITVEAGASGSGVYGPGVIDGQGGQPMIYPPGWGPPSFCQSSSMPANFPSSTMSWWDLANCAAVINHSPGATTTAKQNTPTLIEAIGTSNLTFSGVTLQNSPHAHMLLEQSKNITVWGIKINSPSDLASYGLPRAHNTDGIDLGNVINVTIANSYINDGDDYIAIGSKAGAPDAPSSNITIAGDNMYGGHGVSIGSITSGGIQNVLMQDILVNGGPHMAAIAAIHIKSNGANGGPVGTITYRRFCIGNVKYPIWLDTGYKHLSGGSKPTYSNIEIEDVSIFADVPGSGKIVFDGSGAEGHLQVSMKDVLIDHPDEANSDASNSTDLNLLGKINFLPHGDGVALGPGVFAQEKQAQPSAACKSALAAAPPFPA
jgi:polygalacturonase